MGSTGILLAASLGLIGANAFFVAAEYALVSSRKSAVEAMAKKGHRSARALLEALDDVSPYVAGVQIAITMLSIAIGLVTEPTLTEAIRALFVREGQTLPTWVARTLSVVSLVLITYLTVVFGELVPKYVSLQRPERVALLTIQPLRWTVALLRPLVTLVQWSGTTILRPFGIQLKGEDEVIPKEELLMLVRTGGTSGVLEKTHAEMVSRALRLDALAARDIMIHRLDMKWLDAGLSRTELFKKLKDMPYNRMPVCRGDIDELVGVAYLYDIVRNLDSSEFSLEKIARRAVRVPESLTLDRVVETMRREMTQMLIVVDEYGGTSGLLTLEDVIEEVFGEMQDHLELERPPVAVMPGGRISAQADQRFDELVARLGLDVEDPSTDTLATLVVEGLGQVPKLGDTVESPLGLLRVENMARRRITRITLQLRPEWVEQVRLEPALTARR